MRCHRLPPRMTEFLPNATVICWGSSKTIYCAKSSTAFGGIVCRAATHSQVGYFPPGVPLVQIQATLVGTPAPCLLSCDQGEVPWPRKFERYESSRAPELVIHAKYKWDVDCFLKNTSYSQVTQIQRLLLSGLTK